MIDDKAFFTCDISLVPLFVIVPPMRYDWREHCGQDMVKRGKIPFNPHAKSKWVAQVCSGLSDIHEAMEHGLPLPLVMSTVAPEPEDITTIFVCSTPRKEQAALNDCLEIFDPRKIVNYKDAPYSIYSKGLTIESLGAMHTADGKEAKIFKADDESRRYLAYHAYVLEKEHLIAIIIESKARYKKHYDSKTPKAHAFYFKVFSNMVRSYQWIAGSSTTLFPEKVSTLRGFADKFLAKKDPAMCFPEAHIRPHYRVACPEGWANDSYYSFSKNMDDGFPIKKVSHSLTFRPIQEAEEDISYIYCSFMNKSVIPDASPQEFYARMYPSDSHYRLNDILTADGKSAAVFKEENKRFRELGLTAHIWEDDHLCTIRLHSAMAGKVPQKKRNRKDFDASQPSKNIGFYERAFKQSVASYRWEG